MKGRPVCGLTITTTTTARIFGISTATNSVSCVTSLIRQIENPAATPPESGAYGQIGTLDNPDVFRGPRIAMFASQRRTFHHIPDDLLVFEGMPNE